MSGIYQVYTIIINFLGIPAAVVTGICLLILLRFVPGCTRLARLNAAHLLRPKGTAAHYVKLKRFYSLKWL
jgi:hypothetical protein